MALLRSDLTGATSAHVADLGPLTKELKANDLALVIGGNRVDRDQVDSDLNLGGSEGA